MDFNEVKDPAGVTALLDQLRASQAWQQTISSNTATSKTTGPEVYQSNKEATEPKADNNPTSATVAALLSQLQAASSSDLDIPSYASGNGGFSYVDASSSALTAPAARAADLRSCTFQQALAHISQLSQDVRVADTIRTMKQEQAQLENRLWADREAIQRKHEERVQNARKKAGLIGAELTQFEADSLTDSFRRELQKFDAERVLPAWDGLLAKQQAALESLGVPAIYPTTASAEIQKQVKVLQVLQGALE